MRKIIPLVLLLIGFTVNAQELNCNVVVNHAKVSSSDDYIYDNMQKSIYEFMNNRKWTSDQFKTHERVECTFFITIDSRSSNDFKATIQVQSGRPIFGTNYKTTMFIVNDNDFSFRYVDQQALDYNPNEFSTNLTSVLSYYAYVMLGLDYDSFSNEGGSAHFTKAFDIMTFSQNGGGSGWKSSDGSSNRYWLIENLNNGAFKTFRSCLYNYHKGGLDVMGTKKMVGVASVYSALMSLEKVHNRQPSSYLLQVFFNGKADEVVNIFSSASTSQKNKIVPLLIKIDPGNTKKYNEILK